MYSTPPMMRPPAATGDTETVSDTSDADSLSTLPYPASHPPSDPPSGSLSTFASDPPSDGWRTKRSKRTLPAMRQMARKRAQQRWSALLTANTSRLSREMRGALGERCWAAFVAHAHRYKRPFLEAFDPPDGVLRCVGEYRGVPCPKGFKVDLGSVRARKALRHLELDHEHDVQVTCDLWRRQLPSTPVTWSDGVRDPEGLCRLLFGVSGGAPCVRFRCSRCHDRTLPHYDALLVCV